MSLGRDARDGSCGSEAVPSMYTDLTYFRKWVMRHVEELESIPTSICEKLKDSEILKKRSRPKKMRLNMFYDYCNKKIL